MNSLVDIPLLLTRTLSICFIKMTRHHFWVDWDWEEFWQKSKRLSSISSSSLSSSLIFGVTIFSIKKYFQVKPPALPSLPSISQWLCSKWSSSSSWLSSSSSLSLLSSSHNGTSTTLLAMNSTSATVSPRAAPPRAQSKNSSRWKESSLKSTTQNNSADSFTSYLTESLALPSQVILSYASSSTLYLCQWVSKWVLVSN